MRLGSERIGPLGVLALGAAGAFSIALAAHGYGRGSVVSATVPSQPASSTSHAAPPTSANAANGSTTTTAPASASAGAAKQKLGPLLSSTQYGSYAYQVYPGTPSGQARLATAGFNVHVTPGANTITVAVSAAGSGQGAQTHTYPAGDRVYFVEAAFGDDSGNSDYNFGDDGVVITDANGRIVK